MPSYYWAFVNRRRAAELLRCSVIELVERAVGTLPDWYIPLLLRIDAAETEGRAKRAEAIGRRR